MNIAGIVDTVSNALNSTRVPANVLPPLLLRCTALTRPGLSVYKITTDIIQQNAECGIPTGENPDGSDNLINVYTHNVVKGIVDALKNDAAVHVNIPMQSLLIQVMGANAGGPVTCTGSNILDSIGQGILR
jgi:hypothetical protein